MNWADVGLRRAFYAPAFTEPQWCTVVAYDIGGRAWISMRTHALGISAADVAAIGRTMLDDARSAADNKSANGGSE